MKITMEVKYKGRNYNDIKDAFLAAAVEGIKETMEEKLLPFKNAIQREGGNVILEINGESFETLGGKMKVENVSDELKEKIERAFNA